MMRRLATAFVIVVGVLIPARPAAAHSVTGVQPTNYRSQIIGVTPATPGLTVVLLDLGSRVRLTWHGPDEVVVIDYDGGPYLRIGPGGVFENRRSSMASTPSGAAPTSTTVTPAPAVAAPAPDWHRVSAGSTATWKDRRSQWQGPQPASVAAHTGRAQVVGQWVIPMRRADTDIAVDGRVTWVPPPSAAPWLVAALLLAILIAPLGLLRRWGPPLSAVAALLLANDIVHSVGNAMAARGSVPGIVFKVVVGGLALTAAWVAALWAVPALQRQRVGGLFVAGFAIFAMLMISGLGDSLSLGRSELPYAFAPVMARAAITLAIGGSVGLLGAIVVVLRRHPEYWLADARQPAPR
ncbi:MAG TPA: hypothetical protein VHS52_01410 [Acidimicrobiales bacterium]|nr:hypothetical protein [Acidimicrobiales bacterium]